MYQRSMWRLRLCRAPLGALRTLDGGVGGEVPHVGAQGRPIRNSGDSAYTPSFETYNRGELGTYSLRIRLLQDHYLRMEAEGQSAAETILRSTVERLGYASLEDARPRRRPA